MGKVTDEINNSVPREDRKYKKDTCGLLADVLQLPANRNLKLVQWTFFVIFLLVSAWDLKKFNELLSLISNSIKR